MLKNKCSVWKRIKFPTLWYNCYYFTWSDTYFIQLETLLINHPSYVDMPSFASWRKRDRCNGLARQSGTRQRQTLNDELVRAVAAFLSNVVIKPKIFGDASGVAVKEQLRFPTFQEDQSYFTSTGTRYCTLSWASRILIGFVKYSVFKQNKKKFSLWLYCWRCRITYSRHLVVVITLPW